MKFARLHRYGGSNGVTAIFVVWLEVISHARIRGWSALEIRRQSCFNTAFDINPLYYTVVLYFRKPRIVNDDDDDNDDS